MRILVTAFALGLISACGTSTTAAPTPDKAARATAISKLTGVAASGAVVYNQTGKCVTCHNADGKGRKEVDLAEPSKNDEVAELAGYVLNGIAPTMPSAAFLTDQQIADVIAHLKATYGK